MKAEGAEGLMNLKERMKQCALRIIRMYSTLPKSTEAQVMGRQVLRSEASVGAHSHPGRFSHSGERCGARCPFRKSCASTFWRRQRIELRHCRIMFGHFCLV